MSNGSTNVGIRLCSPILLLCGHQRNLLALDCVGRDEDGTRAALFGKIRVCILFHDRGSAAVLNTAIRLPIE